MRRAYLAAIVVSLLFTLGGSAQAAKFSATINLSNGATMSVAASGTSMLTGRGQVGKGNVHFNMSVSSGAAFQGMYVVLQGIFVGERGAHVPYKLYINRQTGNAYWTVGTSKTPVSGKVKAINVVP